MIERSDGERLVLEFAESGLEIEQRLPTSGIHRRRDVIVHDQPAAVDLSKTIRCADPEASHLRAVLQRPAEAVEAVPECQLTPDGDFDVAHLTANRMLKEGEGRDPVVQLGCKSDVLEVGSGVE